MTPDGTHDRPTERASIGELQKLYGAAVSGEPAISATVLPDLSVYGLEVKRLLGQGGMGAVYLAHQRQPDRDVAVKVLTQGRGDDPEQRERFRREIHALSAVDSPYVVPIHGTGTTPDGRPFYAMELVHGVPLEDHADGENLAEEERLRLLCKICEGVQAAHRQGIIHRDLKPSNILIDEDGRPRILDLGLAKFLDDRAGNWATISRAAQVMGTPAFMAPEQLQPDRYSVDTRVDCYSLGLLLYRLLLHTHPYPIPEGVLATMKTVGGVEPIRPRELSPELPRDLEAILLKALEKDPSRRYQSPSALAAEIESYLGGFPVTAQVPTAFYRSRKFVARNRLPVTISAIAVGVIAVLSAIFIANIVAARRHALNALRSERLAKKELNRQAYLSSLPAIEQRLHDRDFEEAAAMLALAPAEERSWEWQRLSHRAVPWLATMGREQHATCLAPLSETECASGDVAGNLTIWDPASGHPTRSWQAHPDPVSILKVSPDGRELLSVDRRSAKLWDWRTGQLLATFPFQFGGTLTASRSPCFAPQGLFLLPGDEEIRLVDRSGTTRTRMPLAGPLTLCTAAPEHGMVGWCEAYKDDSNGGSLRINRLNADLSMKRVFWLRYPAFGMAVSDDGMRIALAGLNETRVREQETGSFHVISRGRATDVLRFLPGTHKLLMGSARGLEVLQMDGDQHVESHIVTRSPPVAAFPMRQGRELLVLDQSAIHVMPTTPLSSAQLRGPAPDTAWLLAPDGGSIALQDGTLRVYDTRTGACLADFGTVSPTPSLLAYQPDGRAILSARTGCPKLTMHELETRESLPLLPCPQPIVSLAASPTGQIAVQTAEAELHVYTPAAGSWRRIADSVKLQPPPSVPRFSAAGDQLAVSTTGGRLALIDPRDGRIMHRFPSGAYQDIAFSPDGARLAICGFDTGTVWDCRESLAVGTLLPFSAVKGRRALQFTPDGRRIIVGESGGISLWDAATCRKLCTDSVPVKAVAVSAFTEQGRLVVADEAGTLFLLKAAPTTSSGGAESRGPRLRSWQREKQAGTFPVSASNRLVVCFTGTPVDQIPGTPGAHTEEASVWHAQGAHVVLRASPQIPSESELAVTDVLRVCGQDELRAAAAALPRLRTWVERGGTLFVTGTGKPVEALMKGLGLPSPGQLETIRIPPGMRGVLPVRSPTGQFRVFGATQVRRFAGRSAPPSPILARPVGKGRVLAVLGDAWCADAPRNSDSRACLSLGDNRSILQDCIRLLKKPNAEAAR